MNEQTMYIKEGHPGATCDIVLLQWRQPGSQRSGMHCIVSLLALQELVSCHYKNANWEQSVMV